MLPTVVLAAEEALKQVPQDEGRRLRHGLHPHPGDLEGGAAHGLPGILTGVMLAIAGAAGESAPLLFTALFSNYYIRTWRPDRSRPRRCRS
jgi:phosphate transport system permease protein